MVGSPYRPKNHTGSKRAKALLQGINHVSRQTEFFAVGHEEYCAVAKENKAGELRPRNRGAKQEKNRVVYEAAAGIDEENGDVPDIGSDIARIVRSFQESDYAGFAPFPVDKNQGRDSGHAERELV